MKITIRPYKEGRLQVDIQVRRPNGEQLRDRVVSPLSSRTATRRWAEQRAVHLLEQGKTKQVEKSKVPTLAEFAPRFIAEYAVANNEKPSSVQAKESILKAHLVPLLGTKQLDQLGPTDVQFLKAKLAEPMKRKRKIRERNPKTINNILSVLCTLLKVAQEWGIIEQVPRIKLLKWAPVELDYYDFPEWEVLLEAAAAMDSRIHLMLLLGGEAGLRAGEMVALEQIDVDFRRGVLKISRSERQLQVTLPKGGRGREVPLSKRLAEELKANRHLRSDRVLWRDDVGEDGKPRRLERPLLVKWLERAQRRAQLKVTGRLHALRHTFCAHLSMRGAPVMAIKELAGHRQISTTVGYMHLSPAAKESAIRLLDGNRLATSSETAAESRKAEQFQPSR